MKNVLSAVLMVLAATIALPASAQNAGWEPLDVCVLVGGELQVVTARYNAATGDTALDGRSFGQTHSKSSGAYAESAPWYEDNAAITTPELRYVKYGLPRVLDATEVMPVGAYLGVPVFAGAGATELDVIYVPVRPGCEFQPYQVHVAVASTDPVAVRRVKGTQITVGTAPNAIAIEEVILTNEYTDVLVRFLSDEPYGGTLHSPGTEFAMLIRDSMGRTSPFRGQTGWPGNGADGYGSYTVPADTELYVVWRFGPMSDRQEVSAFSILEGTCAEGCWHFINVRLRDR